jgi:hypothetical protein
MWTTSLFLSALLDALATSVQGTLAASLLGQLGVGFLFYKQECQRRRAGYVYFGRIAQTSHHLGLESDVLLVIYLGDLLGLLV